MPRRLLPALSAVLLAVLPAGVFAADACPVRYEPSKALSAYLANVERAMAKIRVAASDARCAGTGTGFAETVFRQPAEAGLRLGNETVAAANEVSDFSSFLSSWDFYVAMPVAQPDAPEFLFRDNELLERTHDKIQLLGRTMARKCGLDAKIPAKSVEIKGKAANAYPAGDNMTVSDVLADLTRANGDALTFFRSVAVGHAAIDPETRLRGNAFFPDGGAADIRASYGSPGRSVCVAGENGDGSRLMASAMRVATFWSAYGDSTRYWREGYELMTHLWPVGGQDKRYNDAEKAILARELNRQGIGGRAADKILRNLDTSNDASHQGMTGFFKSVGERVVGTFTDFGSRIQQEAQRFGAEADKFRARGDGGITANALLGAADGKASADALALDLAANYLAASLLSDNGDSQALAAMRILAQAHRRLQFTYATIVATYDDAEKVCKSQGANLPGSCEISRSQ